MATERPQNLQEVFLNHVRKGKVPLTVFLVNGVRLQGILTWFDSFSLLLKRDAHSQLVYKHSISTILPADPVRQFEEDGRSEPEAPAPLVQISPRVKMPTDDQE
jgi:host factor-I protein